MLKYNEKECIYCGAIAFTVSYNDPPEVTRCNWCKRSLSKVTKINNRIYKIT